MSDIVEWLRGEHARTHPATVGAKAADEIERLRAENEKLREECAKIYVQLTNDKDDKIKQIVDAIKSVKSDNK